MALYQLRRKIMGWKKVIHLLRRYKKGIIIRH
jgi:hypothetical protein